MSANLESSTTIQYSAWVCAPVKLFIDLPFLHWLSKLPVLWNNLQLFYSRRGCATDLTFQSHCTVTGHSPLIRAALKFGKQSNPCPTESRTASLTYQEAQNCSSSQWKVGNITRGTEYCNSRTSIYVRDSAVRTWRERGSIITYSRGLCRG
jgi:hypothetical protein